MDGFDSLKAQPPLSYIQNIYARIARWQRSLWMTSALVSLLSSRYLLVELNVHFPLHLHALHLITAGLLSWISFFCRLSSPSAEAPPERRTLRGWACLVVQAVLVCLAAIFTLQAILHFQNLPTLVMMTTLSFWVESFVLLASFYHPLSWAEILRVGVLPMACVGILIGEYRLLVSGLLTSVPAVLLAGVARALCKIVAALVPETTRDSGRLNRMVCSAGSGLVIGYWIGSGETEASWTAFIGALELRYVPLALVNALSSAGALLLGKSILFPVDKKDMDPCDSENPLRSRDTLTLVAMTGVTGLFSTLMLRRSYTSWVQFASFFVAVGCIGGTAGVDALRNWRRKDHKRYQLLPESLEMRSVDSERTAVSETSEETRVADFDVRRRHTIVRFLFFLAILPVAWTAYATLNFSDRVYQKTVRANPILDTEYAPMIPAELVISMYKEPIDEVAHLVSSLRSMPNLADAQVHIYVKDDAADTEKIKRHTRADNITTLPNIGREGETYLYHILQSWDTLAEHTVFLQADVHNPREFYPRIRDYFDPQRTGMLNLGWSGQVCNCEECGDRWSFQDTTLLFPQIHNRINNATACDKVLLSYKGQFIVSAKRIRGVARSVYHDLREAFVNKDSWAHKEEYLLGRPDSMSAPVFGYTMERMWNLLFQCNDMDVAWKCPTLLSGDRIGGSIQDCQCFDPAS